MAVYISMKFVVNLQKIPNSVIILLCFVGLQILNKNLLHSSLMKFQNILEKLIIERDVKKIQVELI